MTVIVSTFRRDGEVPFFKLFFSCCDRDRASLPPVIMLTSIHVAIPFAF